LLKRALRAAERAGEAGYRIGEKAIVELPSELSRLAEAVPPSARPRLQEAIANARTPACP